MMMRRSKCARSPNFFRWAVIFLGAVVLGLMSIAPAPAQERSPQARVHFDRGIELFNEGRNEAALAEFERAHELAPAFQVLYNIGRVHLALGHAVQAVDAFERYLAEARGIGSERRAEVGSLLEQQRARIARLWVRTNVEGATVSIDGVDVATTPHADAILVAGGSHTVGARAPGHEQVRQALQIAGGVERTVAFELRRHSELRGTLRITALVPGVEVRVDGETMGVTPLRRTLPVPAGAHVVMGERPGYVSERHEITVPDGAEVGLELAMGRDPAASREDVGALRLHIPEPNYTLSIDGEEVGARGGTVELVAGLHALELMVAEREPYRASIEIPGGDRLDLSPPLEWTPDARASLLAEAEADRAVGLWLTIPGGIFLVAGTAVLFWNEGKISATDDLVRRRNTELAECRANALCERDVRDMFPAGLDEDQDRQDRIRLVSALAMGLGAAGTAVGLVFYLGARTDGQIDNAAHASRQPLRLRVRPGGMSLMGSF